MIITGMDFRKLLKELNIRIYKHNEIITLMDLESKSELHPYKYQYDNANLRGNRVNEIEHLKENIFNGTNIDLVLKDKPYKRYGINVKDLSSDYCEKYKLNSFEAFDLSADREYTKTKITFEYDKIKVYETKGYIDDKNNYVTTGDYYFEASENDLGGYISLNDKTNPRLENNKFKIVCKNINGIYTPLSLRDDLENGFDIISDSKYFNTVAKFLYPNTYQGYLSQKLEEEIFSIL